MARNPKKISQTPVAIDVENPRDDVLADVIGVALLRNALYKRIEASVPWGISVAPSDRAMFYLIGRGSALLEVEGEKRMALSTGDAVFIPHGTAHVLRDSPTTEPILVCDGKHGAKAGTRRLGGHGPTTTIVAGFFERGQKPILLARMPRAVMLSPSAAASDPWVTATIQLMLAESAKPGPASSIILQRLADVLFVHAMRSLSTHNDCSPGLAALADPAVHSALALMHTRVEHAWTVEELARNVGLSRSGFAARFTQLVGEPPQQYLARWRIARAAELLRDTSDDLTAIATRVGYESTPSFSKAFKRWHGTSPGSFRRERAAR